MGIFYVHQGRSKKKKLPETKSLLEARANHRKFLISKGIDPDKKVNKKDFKVIPNWWEVGKPAAVAQLVEQLICNHQVPSSNLGAGTIIINGLADCS